MPIIVGNNSVNTSISASQMSGTGALFLVPTGVIFPYAGSSAPTGWLLCDGTAVSRTTYAALFSVIGTTFGAGDGSTTFNLPNASNRVLVGAGGGKTRGSTGGSSSVTPTGSITVDNTTLTTNQLPAHSHGVSDPGHGHGVSDPGHSHVVAGFDPGVNDGTNRTGVLIQGNQPRAYSQVGSNGSGTGISINGSGTGISIQNAGGGQGHNHTASFSGSSISVEQPFVVTNHIIKF